MKNPLFTPALSSLLIALATSSLATAAPVQWIAQGAGNDLNVPSNWDTNFVPGPADDAIFDSTYPSIDTTPTAQLLDFSVATLTFPQSASTFTFNLFQQSLILNGAGITGTNTDANIFSTNANTGFMVQNQIYFNGVTNTSGSAHLDAVNTATVAGSTPSQFLSVINRQVYAQNPFQMDSHGILRAENNGTDNTTGGGNDMAGAVFLGQAIFEDTFTAGSNAEITVTNHGINNGNAMSPNYIGMIIEQQFYAGGPFQADDNLTFTATNSGVDFSSGAGFNFVGILTSNSGFSGRQLELADACALGNNALFNISNNGTYFGTNTGNGSTVGTTNRDQALCSGPFSAGNGLAITVANSATDGTQGVGGDSVGISGSSQWQSDNSFTTGNNATLAFTNSGLFSGSSSMTYNTIGDVSVNQFAVEGPFVAGNDLSLAATTEGNHSGTGNGNDFVGMLINGTQILMNDTCSLGDRATITVSSSGTNTSSSTSAGNHVGGLGNHEQFHIAGNFDAGDFLTLSVSNNGDDSSMSPGSSYTASINDNSGMGLASQILLESGSNLGTNTAISVANSGSYSGSNSSFGNSIGFLASSQFYAGGTFEAGSGFFLTCFNAGSSTGSGIGSNTIGSLGRGPQAHFDQTASFGDDTLIGVANNGAHTGTNTNPDLIGYVPGSQLYFGDILTANNNFLLAAVNSGYADTASNGNNIAYIGGNAQVELNNGLQVGDNATLVVLNVGSNDNATGTMNNIGYVAGSQLLSNGNFTVGKNLTMILSNNADNIGNPANTVGFVGGSQGAFNSDVTLDDGSLIAALNFGTIGGSQLVFSNGFTILSGKATIEALNLDGTLGGNGILVQGNSLGGNANIVLEDSSLYIDTNLPTFTIGELNGNITSIAQSRPAFIIDTDAGTHGVFDGTIQDFPAMSSTLIKQGPGIQKLSGVNTFTGLTTVNQGALILTGSLMGSVDVNPFGILMGTGIVGGDVTCSGIMAPGESIGVLSIFGNFINNNGSYAVEVNGLGQSDLIDVQGTATLNGGLVIASSVDGTWSFQNPYTILISSGRSGTYGGAVSPSFVRPVVTYDDENVYLTIFSDLARAAKTCNQLSVARQLDGIVLPNADQTVFLSSLVNLPLADAQEALKSLSGYQFTDDVWAAEITSRQFIRRLYDPLRPLVTADPCACYPSCGCGYSTWLEMGDGFARLKNTEDANGFHLSSYEVTAGIQSALCYNTTFGAAGSYEYDRVHYSHGGKSNRNSVYLGTYGLYRPEGFYALADIVYGHTSNNLSRSIHAGDIRYKAHSRPNVSQLTFYGELGVDFSCGCFLLQPFAGLQTGRSWRGHVCENRAGGWGLSVDKHNWSATSTRIGVHATAYSFCDCVDASLDLAWNKLLSRRKNEIHARFRNFGNPFEIVGTSLDDNSIDYALTLSTCLCDCLRGYVEFGGEVWKRAYDFDVVAGIEYSW